MARILGVTLPDNKRIEIALTYIYGIGLTTSQKLLKITKVSPEKRVKDLTDAEMSLITNSLKGYTLEGELKQVVSRNIKRLKDIKAYRGIRHKLGLPVRGQRTKTNAVTRKGRNAAVGGLKVKITKT